MKTPLIPIVWSLALCASCTVQSDSTPPAAEVQTTPAADEPALPTPEEEAARAAEAINAANADKELARLESELGGG